MGARLADSSSVTVTPISQADVISIVATAATPGDAARAANIFASTAVDVRTKLFQSGLQSQITRLEQRMAAVPK